MRFVAGRLLQAMLVVLAVATITFVLLHLAPGSPLLAGDSSRFASPEMIAQANRNFGLDRPIHEQYFRYLGRLLRGDFGTSFSLHRPVWDAILEAAPNTILLAFAAWLIDFTLGITLGVFQATRSGSLFDAIASAVSVAVYSTPVFCIGILLLLLFGQVLGWLPVGGVHDPLAAPYLSPVGRALDVLKHLILPALTLGVVGAASTARYQRAALLEVMHQDFVRTARAKGIPEKIVLLRHAVRNALLPVVTLMGLTLPALLSGTVLIESVFGWPGLGNLSATAIFRRDYPVVTGTAILVALFVVLGNLASDLAYRLADPRTRVDA